MTQLLAAHATAIIIVAGLALVATIDVLIWAAWHQEKRTQWLEHELARLHAAIAGQQPDASFEPKTPEVSRRYAEMTELDRTGVA